MEDLVEAMTDDNPVMRPTIEQVVEKFEHMHASLSAIKLRSPITSKEMLRSPIISKHKPSFSVVRCAEQAFRIVRHILSY
jgi:hypothetical protein